jgi:hypothetical protein
LSGLHARSRRQGRKLLAIVAALFVTAACAASAGASKIQSPSGDADCSWGASSITASYVDGVLTESEPQTSGCTAVEGTP